MARIRSIKPEIIEDEKVGPLSDSAFRLFTSLIVLADDKGNVRADVRWLEGQIWWAHVTPPNTLSALIELTRGGLINVYGVRGGTYCHLNGWDKHQRIDNAAKGRLLPAPDGQDVNRISIDQLSAVDHARGNGAIARSDTGHDPVANESAVIDENTDTLQRISANLRESQRIAANRGSDQDQDQDQDPDRELEFSRGSAGAAAPPRKTTKRRKTVLPEGWSPTEDHRKAASSMGIDCDEQARRFGNHHLAKGSTWVDWDRAFSNWLDRALEFKRPATGKTPLEQQIERVRMLEEQERHEESHD